MEAWPFPLSFMAGFGLSTPSSTETVALLEEDSPVPSRSSPSPQDSFQILSAIRDLEAGPCTI